MADTLTTAAAVTRLEGDCREVMRGMAPGQFRCIVTGPPFYGCSSYLFDGHPEHGQEIGAERTPQDYANNLVEVFRIARPLLTDDGVMFLVQGEVPRPNLPAQGSADLVAEALIEDGWLLGGGAVWDASDAHRPLDRVFLFAKTPAGLARVQMPTACWRLPPSLIDDALFYSLPIQLIMDCLLAGTDKGDAVLDPFSGVGNVGVAARYMGCAATLIETDPRQSWIAGDRLDPVDNYEGM